ncbi:MAG: hypothetical protein ABI408_04390 [Gemmatimonadaceae bacterium]
MQLSRLTLVLLVFIGVSACHDSTAPILRTYELTAIDGHPLPVTFMGVDGGSTVLSGRLYLYGSGQAVKVDQYRDYSANGGGMTLDRTEQQPGDYTITNDSIRVGWRVGSCGGPCVSDDIGAFSDSMLTLTIDLMPRTRPVYSYRRIGAF